MRFVALLLAAALLAGCAHQQECANATQPMRCNVDLSLGIGPYTRGAGPYREEEAPPSASPAAPQAAEHHMTLQQRFDEANETHDGRLTMDQAEADNWSWIVNNFAAIDADGQGYVTIGDIRAFAMGHRSLALPHPQPPDPGAQAAALRAAAALLAPGKTGNLSESLGNGLGAAAGWLPPPSAAPTCLPVQMCDTVGNCTVQWMCR